VFGVRVDAAGAVTGPAGPGGAGRFDGLYGQAIRLPVPPGAAAAETVCWWLLTAPQAHPLWSQYALCCVRLRDGLPPVRQYIGTTHELLLVALDPGPGRYDEAAMAGYAEAGNGLPYLVPVNIAEQFIATDDEMTRLAELAARAVANGLLWPETADAPGLVRASWRESLVKTLAHIRGEVHAR